MYSPQVKEGRSNQPHTRLVTWFKSWRFMPWLVLLLSLTTTYHLWQIERNATVQRLQDDFDFHVRESQERIEQRMRTYEQVLRGAKGLFAASVKVERDKFHAYISDQHLEENFPGIQGVGFSLVVSPVEKNKHIVAIRKEKFSEDVPLYSIKPNGERDTYTSIIYLEPFTGLNLRAFGYDMYSEPVRRSAMEQARDSGKAAISGKVRLLQETQPVAQAGFLMYLPVYKNGTPHDTVVERRANILGWVYAPFRMNDLMKGIQGERAGELDQEIFDDDEISYKNLMYDSDQSFGSTKVSRFQAIKHIDFVGQRWTMLIGSSPLFEARLDTHRADLIAKNGVGVSLLLTLLTWLLVNGWRSARAIARKMNSELIASEQSLHDSEEKLQAVLNASEIAIAWANEDGVIEYVNPKFIALFGYTLAEVPNVEQWYLRAYPDEAYRTKIVDEWNAKVSRSLPARGSIGSMDVSITCKDGAVRYVIAMGSWAGTKLLVNFGDITERKLQEVMLQFRMKLIEMSSQTDHLHLMQATLDIAEELTGSTIGFFHYVEKDQETISLQAWSTNTLENMCKADESGQHYPVSQAGVWADAIRSKTTVIQNDYPHLEKKKGMPEGHAVVERFVSIPILRNDQVVAMIGVGNKPSDYGAADVEVVSQLANHVFDLINTNKIQQALRESEEMFRKITESAQDAVIMMDAAARVTAWNLAAERLFGYSAAEAIGQELHPLIAPPEAQLAFKRGYQHFLETGTGPIIGKVSEVVAQRKNGEAFPVEVSLSSLQIRKQWHAIGIFRDITERKKSEEAVKAASKYSRSLIESSLDPLVTISAEGKITDVNAATENVTGVSRAKLIGSDFADYFTDSTKAREGYQQVFSQGLVIDYPLAIRHVSGRVTDVLYNASVYRDDSGKVLGVFAAARDITERKQSEEKLRITASVFGNSQEGILITDAGNNIVDINPAFTKITGYGYEEVIGQNPKLLSSGHQDQAFYVKMWNTLKQDGAWRGEIWNRRKSGEIYAEMLSISIICDNDGKILRHVGVFSDISHLKEHEAELNRVAYYDALTGIPNRVMLADRMKQAIAQTARDQNMMSICYLDLDGFKPVNDTLGHEAGDEVLIEVARRIGNTIRGGDTVARLGGDEFVVLLLGQERAEECVTTLERLLTVIAQPITVKGGTVMVSASIGVSIYPLDNDDTDILMRHADQAMYAAKEAGKNRFHIYDAALDRRARDQHEFLKSIRYGLAQNQFELYYQPKVKLSTKELVGAEALIRWRHPDRGLLAPAEFLHFIENTDLDIELGEWVTASVLAQMNRWRQVGFDIEVSINITGYHLESPHFVERLQQQLKQYPDVGKGKLQIEVLETVALKDIAIVQKIIESCRDIGVGFALDDFGTGYSSLSYLKNLPVEALKIDQSFIRHMLKDKGDMAIVQGIIALAGAFNRQTVAEGIETDEHYQVLLNMGCHLGQGYGIARPMSADDLRAWRGGHFAKNLKNQ